MTRRQEEPALYFKHLYGSNPNELGVVGFPKSQSPAAALCGFRSSDLVLLAVTKDPELYPELWQGLQGKIFAACTLLLMDRPTRYLANPGMVRRYPLLIKRWPQATPIREFWRFDEPKKYDEFGDGELMRLVSNRRGHLIRLNNHPKTHEDVRAWFRSAEKKPDAVYQSPLAKEHQERKGL